MKKTSYGNPPLPLLVEFAPRFRPPRPSRLVVPPRPLAIPPLHGLEVHIPQHVAQEALNLDHRRPVQRIGAPAPLHQAPEARRPQRVDLEARPPPAEHDHVVELVDALYAVEGLLEGAYLPEEHPEGVHVDLLPVPELQRDLRRHVPARPARLGEGTVPVVRLAEERRDRRREAEVEHLHAVVAVEPDVGRLEVAEDHVTAVEVLERVGDGVRDLEPLAQVLPKVPLGRDVRQVAVDDDPVDRAALVPPLLDPVVERGHEAVEDDEVPLVARRLSLVLVLASGRRDAVRRPHREGSGEAPLGPAVERDDVGMVEAGQKGGLVRQVLGADDELARLGAHGGPRHLRARTFGLRAQVVGAAEDRPHALVQVLVPVVVVVVSVLGPVRVGRLGRADAPKAPRALEHARRRDVREGPRDLEDVAEVPPPEVLADDEGRLLDLRHPRQLLPVHDATDLAVLGPGPVRAPEAVELGLVVVGELLLEAEEGALPGVLLDLLLGELAFPVRAAAGGRLPRRGLVLPPAASPLVATSPGRRRLGAAAGRLPALLPVLPSPLPAVAAVGRLPAVPALLVVLPPVILAAVLPALPGSAGVGGLLRRAAAAPPGRRPPLEPRPARRRRRRLRGLLPPPPRRCAPACPRPGSPSAAAAAARAAAGA
ncbi:hypothetical protein THAOC_13981, partial [Thalassiosira oceanica]